MSHNYEPVPVDELTKSVPGTSTLYHHNEKGAPAVVPVGTRICINTRITVLLYLLYLSLSGSDNHHRDSIMIADRIIHYFVPSRHFKNRRIHCNTSR